MQERVMGCGAHSRRSTERGFTLIELLIVIAVLGILAAIVIFNVTGVTNKGSTAACKVDLHSVEVATLANYNDNRSYPTGVGQLVPTYLHTAPTYVGNLTFTADGQVTSDAC